MYCANNPLVYTDPDGRAHFGKRPMKTFHDYWGIGASNSIDNLTNTELSHEQLFFDDDKGGNLGFSWDGLFEEPKEAYDKYHMDKKQYDDDLMRKAVKNVDIKSIGSSALSGFVSGFISSGLSSISTVKSALEVSKAMNATFNVASNAVGTTIGQIAENALNNTNLTEDLGSSVLLSVASGFITGGILSKTGASETPSNLHGWRKLIYFLGKLTELFDNIQNYM